jgi:hypothetical protein
MLRWLRIVAGLVLSAVLLYLADLAVRDCTSGLYTYDNCFWLWAREQTGLPNSKIWRAAALEVVGIGLLAGLYVTVRHIFPNRVHIPEWSVNADAGGQIIQKEVRILQALCQGTLEGSELERGKSVLKNYKWQEPLHRLVFEVLNALPASTTPMLIREQLPSRLTRTGFPDVEWGQFFEPHSLSREEAERLMRELAGSS